MSVDRREAYYQRAAKERARDPMDFMWRYERGLRLQRAMEAKRYARAVR